MRLTQFHGLNVADPRERIEDRAQAAVTSDNRGTVYEITLPLASLLVNGRERLEEGRRVGIGIAVIETSGGIRIREFGNGIVSGLNAAGLPQLQLVNTSTDKSRYFETLRSMLPDHPAAPRDIPADEPVISQHVYLDPDEAPSAIALVCQSRSDGFDHGAYWADSPLACGGFVRPTFRYMGKPPASGAWQDLRVPRLAHWSREP